LVQESVIQTLDFHLVQESVIQTEPASAMRSVMPLALRSARL
jgi:hypothetical protein